MVKISSRLCEAKTIFLPILSAFFGNFQEAYTFFFDRSEDYLRTYTLKNRLGLFCGRAHAVKNLTLYASPKKEADIPPPQKNLTTRKISITTPFICLDFWFFYHPPGGEKSKFSGLLNLILIASAVIQ